MTDDYMANWPGDALVDFVERMGLYYGWDGQPISRDEWLALFMASRTVGLANTTRGQVSTIFMGTDLGFGMGPPLLFETMVFGGVLDSAIGRYATLEEARAGHAEWVRLLRGSSRPLIHNGKKWRFGRKNRPRV